MRIVMKILTKLKHLWKELTHQVERSSRGKIPKWFEKA